MRYTTHIFHVYFMQSWRFFHNQLLILQIIIKARYWFMQKSINLSYCSLNKIMSEKSAKFTSDFLDDDVLKIFFQLKILYFRSKRNTRFIQTKFKIICYFPLHFETMLEKVWFQCIRWGIWRTSERVRAPLCSIPQHKVQRVKSHLYIIIITIVIIKANSFGFNWLMNSHHS